MPLPGVYTGVLPAFTYVPKTGPTGVLPARAIAGPGIPPPTNSGRGMGTNAPVPVGGGYISRSRRATARMDVVNGFDRTLGKTRTIPQGERMAQGSKNLGNLSTAATIGPLAGSLGRMFSAYF